jgi:hypothetical protein
MNTATMAPRKRKEARPAHGTCRLTLTINGVPYDVRPVASDPSIARKAYRLRKSDGTTYDVAWTDHGIVCDCPDFEYRRNGLTDQPCKHGAALVALGMLG